MTLEDGPRRSAGGHAQGDGGEPPIVREVRGRPERPIGSDAAVEEREFEASLRPRRLAEYVGQPRIKRNLSVFIQAASKRGEALDHVLLSGPPGLGKTTLAHIIAAEMGVAIRITAGPTLEKPGDLAAILTRLERHDV